jgi:mono/diheme cytochrome c family protein
MKIYALLILVALSVVLISVSCGPAPTPEPTPTPQEMPGKALVASRCIGCHELNRVKNASYDKEGWQKTVDRMVLSGAQLSDEQVTQVVDYLAQAYPKE